MAVDGGLVVCLVLIGFGFGHFCGWVMGWGDRERSLRYERELARHNGSQAVRVPGHE